MSQVLAHPADEAASVDCVWRTAVDSMLPFFVAGACGDEAVARAAISALLDAYHPATVLELDFVARIVMFSMTAMDNLRLSMADPAMSDTRKLRYRSNAIALSRSAEQCRLLLEAMQARRQNAATRAAAVSDTARPGSAFSAAAVQPPASRPVGQRGPAALETAAEPAVQLVDPPTRTAPPGSPAGSATAEATMHRNQPDARTTIQGLYARGAPLAEASVAAPPGSGDTSSSGKSSGPDPSGPDPSGPDPSGPGPSGPDPSGPDSSSADPAQPGAASADPSGRDPFAAAKAAAHAALAAAGFQRTMPNAAQTMQV